MMRPAVVHLQKSSSSSSKKRPQYIVLDSVTETLPDAVHMNRRTAAADTAAKSIRRDNPTQQPKTHARNDFYETSHLDMNAAASSKLSLAGKSRHYSPLKSSSTNEMMMIAHGHARQDVPVLELHAHKKLDGEKRKEKMRVYKAKPINLSNKNYIK